MAWKVNRGVVEGGRPRGLCVAAAVHGDTTFSEDNPEKARAVLIVDSRARRAAAGGADRHGQDPGRRAAWPDRRPVAVTRMSLKLEDHATDGRRAAHAAHGMPQSPRASFWAAGLAQIVTRPLDERDHVCGNEVVAYPPALRSR